MLDQNMLQQAIIRALQKYGPVWVKAIQDKLIQDKKINTVQLYDSVKFQIVTGDHQVTLNILALPYLKWVDKGRDPGSFPNFDKLLEWVESKPIVPREVELPSGKTKLPTTKQVAFLIGRKIQEEGIKPTFILKESSGTSIGTFYVDLKDELLKSFQSEATKIFADLKKHIEVKLEL